MPTTTDSHPPCRHMERLLNEAASGRTKGFARWYALAHAARCAPCSQFLRAIELAITRLRQERDTYPDVDAMSRLQARTAQAIQQALDEKQI